MESINIQKKLKQPRRVVPKSAKLALNPFRTQLVSPHQRLISADPTLKDDYAVRSSESMLSDLDHYRRASSKYKAGLTMSVQRCISPLNRNGMRVETQPQSSQLRTSRLNSNDDSDYLENQNMIKTKTLEALDSLKQINLHTFKVTAKAMPKTAFGRRYTSQQSVVHP